MENEKLTLVIPQYNDWESLQVLLEKIDQGLASKSMGLFQILIVDDHSLESKEIDNTVFKNLEITIIRLIKNMGHQRAIAIGLCYTYDNLKSKWVGVMDGDGEDLPEDLFKLKETAENRSISVFAKRSKRSEGVRFQMFYWIYKIIFQVFTGKRVNFGNFSVLDFPALQPIVHDSNLWNNYAIAFLKSKIPFSTIPTKRGTRIAGNSKMDFTQLIIHGLSGIAIFADVVTTRIILFSLITIIASLIGIFVVIGIRLISDLAIPGWATYSVLGFSILLFQALLTSFFTLFIFLSNRSSLGTIPVKEYKFFIS